MTDDTTPTTDATPTSDATPTPGPTGAQPAVVIERVVAAPVELVWRTWTEPDHVAAWYGPTGASIPEVSMDVRVGGLRRLCMEMPTPDGPMRMWFTGEYVEVAAPHRLVYTESMCDEDGRVLAPAAAGLPADHPTTTRVTVELHDHDGRTRLVVTHAGIPADSPGATGWAMALDGLVAHLAAQR